MPTIVDASMRYFRLAPDRRLRPWVKCYWWVEPRNAGGSSQARSSPLPDLLIPDGHSELVFRLAGGFTRWPLESPASRRHMSSSYVIGGRARSVMTLSPGGFRAAGVKLDPRALRALLRRPLTDFRDNTVDCAALDCDLLELEDRIGNLPSVDGLPALLDRFFLQRLPHDLHDDAATDGLLDTLRATRGSQPILAWVRQHRLDARSVERRFVARVGMTPKQFARVVRFEHAYRALNQPEARARGAHLDPYYDESHFDREFRQFMGTSPVAWLGRRPGFTTIIGDHLLDASGEAR